MSAMKRKTSIKEVAKAAGVSIASVSRVINSETGKVSPAVRTRVEKAIADLNYRPNWIGQALRGQTNNTYAMVISSIQNNFFSSVAWEIESRLNDRGAAMLLFNSNEDAALQERCLKEVRSRQVAGVFMLCALDSPQLHAIAGQTPMIFINRKVPSLPDVPFIGIDDRSAAMELARAILQEHEGEIALVSGPQSSATSRARLDGFRAEFEARNRPVADESIKEAELSMESGYACAVALLEDRRRYSAIVCGNDQIAYGVYRRCRELGLSIPVETAIYGFDDNPLNQWLAPWLNTVRVPYREYAEAAIGVMDKLHKGDAVGPTILPYDLVLRR
ncbi:LacI family DNA-binding transcriptional regulator [Oceaniglobus trochenteri]|uniref:LacI family DNA-binding transcriptional regulator n=1 Tax=Oceaniglobus trochenteri TaxID=2763260 RepID=UPI001D000ED0|nr:LacI family DNA-binding transcriptional regulator [Oceaniglobus trochenteri]